MTDTRDVTKAETNRIVQHLTGMTPYTLARIADCGSPDTQESAGAEFLTGVRDDLVELIEALGRIPDGDREESDIRQIADEAPSIWTATVWAEFVDLAAYQEDISEYGTVPLDKAAATALYDIARRLIDGLIEEATS